MSRWRHDSSGEPVHRLLAVLVALVGFTAVVPPAEAAVSVTITTSPASLLVGSTSVIKGKAVNAKPGSVVKLQHQVSGVWRDVKTKQVWSARTYYFMVKPEKGYQYYRVIKPRQLGQPYAVSARARLTVKWRPAITGGVSHVQLADGTWAPRLAGAAPASAGRSLVVQIKNGTAWTSTPGRIPVDSDGRYHYDFVNRGAGEVYRAYSPASGALLAAGSPHARIDQLPLETELWATSRIRREGGDSWVEIQGSVGPYRGWLEEPYRAGRVVHLQELVDGVWVNRQVSAPLTAMDFRFEQRPLVERGPQRVMIDDDGPHAGAVAPVPDTNPVVVDGELSGPTVHINDRDGGRERRIRFSGNAGDLVSYHVLARTSWATAGHAVLDSAGREVVPVPARSDLWRLPVDGTYFLRFIPTDAQPYSAEISIDRQVTATSAVGELRQLTAEPHQAVEIKVPVTEGTDLSLAIRSQLSAHILATGPQGEFASVDAGPWRMRHVVPSTGSYVITVINWPDYTKTFSFAASEPKKLTATPNGGPVALGDLLPGQVPQVHFRANAGDIIGDWLTPGSAAPIRTTLRRAGGSAVTAAESSLLRRDTWDIETAGDYYLEYTTEYDWTDADFDTAEVTSGERITTAINAPPVTATTAWPGQVVAASFDAVRGERITIALSDPQFAGGSVPVFTLRSPDGSWSSIWSAAPIRHFTAPQSGRYEVRARTAEAGSFNFGVSTPDVTAGELDGEAVQVGTGHLPGRTMAIEFRAAAGDVVTAHAAPGGDMWDGHRRLSGREGEVLEREGFYRIPKSGTYTLEYLPKTPTNQAAAVRLYRAQAVDAAIGTTTQLSVTDPGRAVVVSFDSVEPHSAGTYVRVIEAALVGGPTRYRVSIYKPDGSYVLGYDQDSSSIVGFDTVPGTYTAVVVPGTGLTGTMQLGISH